MAYPKRLFRYFATFGLIAICMLTIPVSSIAQDTIIYGGNAYGRSDVIEINLTTGPVSTSGLLFDTQAIAQDPATGYVYYFEWASGNDLAYWVPGSGSSVVRTYDPTPWGFAKRAAFGPDGYLYLMDDDGDLYTIDKDNGEVLNVRPIQGLQTGSSSSGDMAFGPDNMLYIVISENLYRVDMESDPLVAETLATNMIPGGGWTVWTGLAICDGKFYASDVNFFNLAKA